MSDYFIIQDTQKCIGCHACEIQCKTHKSLPVGPKLCQVIEVGPRLIDGLPRASFVFLPCFHCHEAWCMTACPTGAMQRRSDGIVFVDADLCVGCKACIIACPWGTPQWNPETGKVVKCDYCMDRIDQGLEPACVTVCVTHCLHFEKTATIPQVKRERYAQTVATFK